MTFSNKADEAFFIHLLCDQQKLLESFAHLFDFRQPNIKRKEFNNERAALLTQLLKLHGKACMLMLNDKCGIKSGVAIDHLIPLSSNILNKTLRKLKPEFGKKVVTQSFGSNHIDNLVIACNNCNNHKKHRFLDKDKIQSLLKLKGLLS